MDFKTIQNTIEELENSETNFFNCQNLAHLYIVREYYRPKQSSLLSEDELLTKELSDIFPQYRKYIELKKKYQSKEIPKEAVIGSMEALCEELCEEIKDFLLLLYCNSDMPEERKSIKDVLDTVSCECKIKKN